jgi:hypothetical protein
VSAAGLVFLAEALPASRRLLGFLWTAPGRPTFAARPCEAAVEARPVARTGAQVVLLIYSLVITRWAPPLLPGAANLSYLVHLNHGSQTLAGSIRG